MEVFGGLNLVSLCVLGVFMLKKFGLIFVQWQQCRPRGHAPSRFIRYVYGIG